LFITTCIEKQCTRPLRRLLIRPVSGIEHKATLNLRNHPTNEKKNDRNQTLNDMLFGCPIIILLNEKVMVALFVGRILTRLEGADIKALG